MEKDGKVLNPLTKRYITIGGDVFKKLVKSGVLNSDGRPSTAPTTPPKKTLKLPPKIVETKMYDPIMPKMPKKISPPKKKTPPKTAPAPVAKGWKDHKKELGPYWYLFAGPKLNKYMKGKGKYGSHKYAGGKYAMLPNAKY